MPAPITSRKTISNFISIHTDDTDTTDLLSKCLTTPYITWHNHIIQKRQNKYDTGKDQSLLHSIRHKIKGENTFFISERFDRKKMMEYASLVLAESKAEYAIVGWIDYLRGNFSADLELVGNE